MNTECKELKDAVINSFHAIDKQVTKDLIKENLTLFKVPYETMHNYKYSDLELQLIIRHIESVVPHRMNEGHTLKDASHQSWLNEKKDKFDSYYWDRYKNILKKDRSKDVVAKTDIVTDEILDLLQDPSDQGRWIRKGLVVGDVQSGKTGNIIGLVNKAFDAGYRLVIVLSGLLNSLRQQTQERFDQGVIGVDSSIRLKDLRLDQKLVGVGKIDKSKLPITITTVDEDFNIKYAQQNQQSLEQYSRPIVFVVKKNVSILKNLIGWLQNNNFNLDQYPLLLIDDESDHASINTNKEDLDPTKTNKRIRELLNLFSKKIYLGYTATPFANIFIDPDTPDEMMHDLFPENFIKVLDPPDNYHGSQKIYVNNETTFIREISDHVDILPIKHRINDIPDILPESLEKAVKNFILVCAIRLLRGDENENNSMLVNVSRFTGIQSQVRLLIHTFLSEVVDSIKGNYALPEKEALENVHMKDLFEVYRTEYSDLEFSWEKIQSSLKKASAKIDTIEVNGSKDAEKIIDYSKLSYPNGRSLIAVGGFSLSRGITIEGLSVTYFLRNSFAYDTLMQMGRWFGYRPRYEDLCRIYMTQESIGYYNYISQATEELKEEFRIMANATPPRTPKDFGLKVRNHEGALLVTARNKMRSSRTVIRSIDLTGAYIQNSRVFSSRKFIERNLTAYMDLYGELTKNEKLFSLKSSVDHKLWKNVSSNYVKNFLLQFENHPLSPKTDTDLVLDYINKLESNSGIKNWNILFDIPRNNEKIQITLNEKINNLNPSVRRSWINDDISNSIQFAQRSLGSETIKIQDLNKGETRKTPLLILHLLDFRDKQGKSLFKYGNVGFSINFPSEKVVGRVKIDATYQANIKWFNDHYNFAYENDEDLGDEIKDFV